MILTAVRQPIHRTGRSGIPGLSDRGEYVYVVLFTTGIVKVGRSRNPADRLATHAQLALRHGAALAKQWVSPPHGDSVASEKRLVEYCLTRGARAAGLEYFRDIAFDEVVRFAETLTFKAITKADRERIARSLQNRQPLFQPTPRAERPPDDSLWINDEGITLLEEALRLDREDLGRIAPEDRPQVDEMVGEYLRAMHEVAIQEAQLKVAEEHLKLVREKRGLVCSYLYHRLGI